MASNDIISSLGAGSGIDIAKLVTQLTAVERAPHQERLDARKEKLEAQISGYGQLKSSLDSVQTAMAALGDNDLFNARSVSVPSSDVITANKVAPGAQTGTYKVEVTQVASAQSLAMASQSDRAAALGKSGDLNIRFGEWEDASTFNVNNDRASLKISVAATDSLDTIAEKINSQNAGVQASVLKVDGQFQLMLTSPSGKSNAMEITGSTASLSDFNFNSTNRTATQTQAAQDAELTLNGLKVTRESNDIDDVIPGLSFTINKASPSESLSFSITADKSTAEQSIRDFVTAYNTFQKSAQELVGYSRDKDNKLVRGALAGDSAARTMISRLRETIGGSVPGVQSGFTALTNVGIRTERDGSLSIDEKEFSAAISGNFNQLESLFATRSSSTNTAVSVNPGTFANRAVSGTHDVEIIQDPTKGQVVGNAVSHADFNAATDTFATALNTSAVDKDYSFKISVDGIKSSTIKLTGTYAGAEGLRADLQSQINGDATLKKAGAAVDVRFDTATNQFSFVSREYGSISKVSVTEASADMAALGIASSGLTSTDGVDVKGTINGQEGFGAGNVLLPALDSAAYGLNLSVSEGATAQGAFQISFSRGIAGELSKLIDDFQGAAGVFKTREDGIQKQLDGIKEEVSLLDTRMEGVSARLTAQFTAMERIVSSLKDTGSQLDGLNDRLPFTASS